MARPFELHLHATVRRDLDGPGTGKREDRSDEMTWFIYALKEIRACLEAEMLTDAQRRLTMLSRDMDNHNGQRITHQPAVSRN